VARRKKNLWHLMEKYLTLENTAIIKGKPAIIKGDPPKIKRKDDPFGWICVLNDGTKGFADSGNNFSPFELTEIRRRKFNASEIGDNTHYLLFKENGKIKCRFFKLSDVASIYYCMGWINEPRRKKRNYFNFKFNSFKGKTIDDIKYIVITVNPTEKKDNINVKRFDDFIIKDNNATVIDTPVSP